MAVIDERFEKRVSEDYPEVADFVLSFIHVLLKTGYYDPDHPEFTKAREDLFDGLQTILKGRKELMFLYFAEQEKQDVVVDGVTDEPFTTRSMMTKGMADTFVPKFVKFFEAKDLTSFSLKSTITKQQFDDFVDIMSDTPKVKEGEDAAAFDPDDLVKKNVMDVSTLFNVDMVGKDRNLPWRVELALTRLKKDLSVIPLYKDFDEKKMAEVRNAVFDDIVKPIGNPRLVKDLLVNMDLISRYIKGVDTEVFEARVLGNFQKEYLRQAAPGVLETYISTKKDYEESKEAILIPRVPYLRQMARKVALKVMDYGLMDKEVLVDFCDSGVLTFDELSERLKIKARRREELEKFLEDPASYYKGLDEPRGPETGRAVFVLLNFVPELLMVGRYDEASEILSRIKAMRVVFASVDTILFEEIIALIEKQIGGGTKEEQIKVLGMVDMLGKSGFEVLVNLFTHESRVIRRMGCDLLVGHGSEVIPVITSRLKKRTDWYFIRNAVMVLSDIVEPGSKLGKLFIKYIEHSEARVRVEAVKGFLVTTGTEGEARLAGLIGDPDPIVRRKVVWALGELRSTRPEVMDYFVGALSGELDEDESIVDQVLSSVQGYPPDGESAKRLVETVREMLTKGIGIMGKISLVYESTVHMKASMSEMLGHLGGPEVTGLLKKVARKVGPPARDKALEAIERIEKRQAE